MNGYTTSPFADSSDVTATVQAYATNQFEASQDKLSPGLQNALYFSRNAAGVTSINGLMSDTTMLKVVVSALGMDATAYGQLDFAQQQQLLTQKVTLSDFQDPTKVNKMVENYLVRQSAGQASATSSASAALSILNGTADGSGVLGAIFGGGSGTGGGATGADILSSLYPSSSSSTGDPMLQLFA
jgi:hypothetical protein